MQFTLLLSALITMIMSTLALPTGDTRLAQLRLYGEPGCYNANMGELGIYGSALNQCKTFPGNSTIESVSFEYNVGACSVQIFTEDGCASGQHNVTVGQCLSGDSDYVSYKLVCN
ncbi:hypothetical protein AbraIFM66951_011927 [Aspergillus brasiliensis]|uniref:Cyanovirin-N domain-containing protein n=1 Tax=Aspergillus brasiliensis TaxID=319629 RepID=A0A9W5YYU8_9EURO|nr:hypothetical protein AbraCBS73388_011647 [Aspergillus brasiliensis]GKZ48169.1 hypothetical protein AbraIFM66951_011927 [Aspergillus brasiliensis]